MCHDPESGIALTAELFHSLAENDQRSNKTHIICTIE